MYIAILYNCIYFLYFNKDILNPLIKHTHSNITEYRQQSFKIHVLVLIHPIFCSSTLLNHHDLKHNA